MRLTLLAVLTALALPAVAASAPASHAAAAHAGAAVPAYLTAAINDPARQADTDKDDRRKLAAVMSFAKVKPGQKVLELVPGGGYFTRVFSAVVGAHGHVYAAWPDEYAKVAQDETKQLQDLIAQPHYANVSLLSGPAAQLKAPEPVDLVFTAQNYHDYPDAFMGKVDPVALDKQVFAALKPGGLFVVIDHVAEAGSGMRDTDTLHRIDPAIVKQQVLSAGFVFDGESEVLRNPSDAHKVKVFDPSIRGHTDQFVFRFRKPAH